MTEDYGTRLIKWYHQCKREMPWRKTTNPYYIWVSEVMLQQTKVDTVIPYYERFIDRFPTIESLAQASLEEVHRYWQGLGYYRRAENLQKGAKLIAREYDGVFPRNISEVKKIPGIGPYTLGAVMSIAFHIPLPAVDGNVMRILSRQFLMEEDIGIAKNRKVFEEKVMELMPSDPNSFNQALMELGATICTPTSPKCDRCPVLGLCQAYEEGVINQFPVKEKKQKVTVIGYDVVLFKKENSYWMEKREATGLLANLWGFPMIEKEKGIEKSYEKQYLLKGLPKVNHIFTHRKWEMKPLVLQYVATEWSDHICQQAVEGKFVTLEEMKHLPIATAFLKIVEEIEKTTLN